MRYLTLRLLLLMFNSIIRRVVRIISSKVNFLNSRLHVSAETVEKGSVSGNILNFAIYDFQFSFKLFLSMSKNSSAIFLQISYYFLLI